MTASLKSIFRGFWVNDDKALIHLTKDGPKSLKSLEFKPNSQKKTVHRATINHTIR